MFINTLSDLLHNCVWVHKISYIFDQLIAMVINNIINEDNIVNMCCAQV